jgi:hypothetical protein
MGGSREIHVLKPPPSWGAEALAAGFVGVVGHVVQNKVCKSTVRHNCVIQTLQHTAHVAKLDDEPQRA